MLDSLFMHGFKGRKRRKKGEGEIVNNGKPKRSKAKHIADVIITTIVGAFCIIVTTLQHGNRTLNCQMRVEKLLIPKLKWQQHYKTLATQIESQQ